MNKLWQTSKVKVEMEKGEYQIDGITYAKGVLLEMHWYAYKGEGGWKIGHKIRTYQIDGPKHIFCVLVRPSTLEHTVLVFFRHNYDYFILCNN